MNYTSLIRKTIKNGLKNINCEVINNDTDKRCFYIKMDKYVFYREYEFYPTDIYFNNYILYFEPKSINIMKEGDNYVIRYYNQNQISIKLYTNDNKPYDHYLGSSTMEYNSSLKDRIDLLSTKLHNIMIVKPNKMSDVDVFSKDNTLYHILSTLLLTNIDMIIQYELKGFDIVKWLYNDN